MLFWREERDLEISRKSVAFQMNQINFTFNPNSKITLSRKQTIVSVFLEN